MSLEQELRYGRLSSDKEIAMTGTGFSISLKLSGKRTICKGNQNVAQKGEIGVTLIVKL